MTDDYEVRNESIEESLKDIGRTIAPTLPDGWGFSLFIFDYGAGGSTFYISNANRQDMIKMLQEFIERQREP